MKFRPIEKVKTIMQEATGLDIMYAYDDLVFSEYGVLIFQFDEESGSKIHCFFNRDYDEDQRDDTFQKLKNTSSRYDFTIEQKGRFHLKQVGQEVRINFN